MTKVFYLAYGSNLHPLRLKERVSSANALGVVELSGYELKFHKRSDDCSGKCMLERSSKESGVVYAVLYEFDKSEKSKLDSAEGAGKGYFEEQMSISLEGKDYTAYIYMASSTHINSALIPYTCYKNFVLAGARFHKLPAGYISSIESVLSIEDKKEDRRKKNQSLLKQMLAYSEGGVH